jgi:hypothetical protein
MKNSEYKKVFNGGHLDANQVKYLLEAHNIPAFLKDDAMGRMFPLFVSQGGLHPVKVFVSAENYEQAKELLEAYFS